MKSESKNNQTCDIESRIIRAPNGKLDSILGRLKVISAKGASVLLLGKTGTGKELLANYLVEQTPESYKKPYEKVNCIGLPETIIESELYGHAKNSFTGATRDKKGLMETVDGGTLLLDEIGALPWRSQANLLRVLEEKKIRRVGETKLRPINVRFIAATNRWKKLIPDLKYRFEYLIKVPPLKERPEDVPYLLKHFLKGSPFNSIGLGALFCVALHHWKGNVRQLKNLLAEATITVEVDSSPRRYEFQTDSEKFVFTPWHLGKDIKDNYNRYESLRTDTNFDRVMYLTYPIKRVKLPYADKSPFPIKDILYLSLDEKFPEIATELIRACGYLFKNENWKEQLKERYANKNRIWIDVHGHIIPDLGIRMMKQLLKGRQEKVRTDLSLGDLTWDEMKKRYWFEFHEKNPHLKTKKERFTKMGIAKPTYSEWERKFT